MDIIKGYQTRVEGLAGEVERIRGRFVYIHLVRFAAFLVALVGAALSFSGDCLWWEVAVAIFSFVGFLILVKVDAVQSARRDYLQRKLEINREELSAIDFDFAERSSGAEYAQIAPHLMADFDVVGVGSIFQYINRSVTRQGELLFVNNLCREELRSEHIRNKQLAIRELADKVEFVQDFRTRGSFFTESTEEFEYLQRWVQMNENSKELRTLRVLSILVPAISAVWLLLFTTSVIGFSTIWIALTANIVISGWNMRAANSNHAQLGRATKIIKKYAELIKIIEKEEFKSQYLNNIKAKLFTKDSSASSQINRLRKLLNLFDNRNNLFAILVLNGTYGFSLQILRNLLSWKCKYGEQVESWINAISEFDALLGYGVYAYNSSGKTTFPTINDGSEFSITANGVAHPLIPDKVRVANDITISKSPAIIIITGANMAGKSTFLRTVAVNMILGMNGSVVAAEEFAFTPAHILSSIKIQDSLAKNESYFYAEISRLRDIVDMVNGDGLKLVVLDEILRGTNNKDKQIGSLGLLQKLISNNAIVFIATHDLVIGELEQQYPDVACNYCFEVELDNNHLLFDYKLKNGVSQKLNASYLLRDMGLID